MPERDGDSLFEAHTAVVLGAAQDAGMPHLGCTAPLCERARRAAQPQRVAALGVCGAEQWWLLDATPDMTAQIHAMGSLPAGIFLTHAHIGHYTGLMYLGREGLDADGMPVYATRAMAEYLRSNGPWSQLVELDQIELRVIQGEDPVVLEEGLRITPLPVPHRDELSDTVAFLVEREGGRSLLYLPDIDSWEEWDRELAELAGLWDYLLVDGSFYSGAELPGRDLSEIPHPPVVETMERLDTVMGERAGQVVFTHMNHTNPLWDPDSAATAELRRRGFATVLDVPRFRLEDP